MKRHVEMLKDGIQLMGTLEHLIISLFNYKEGNYIVYRCNS